MCFTLNSLRSIAPFAAGLALALSVRAQEPAMPQVPSDVKAPPADASKTESGLASKVLQEGTGAVKPTAEDTVTVHYSGWTTDGKMFDSSVSRGQPASFPLKGVIKGWTEGLQLMVEGEKRRFWIPGNLAYGDEAAGGRPSGMLVFDVELLSIKTAPRAPEDVAKAPDDAQKTASGLASKVLQPGTGANKPGAADTVTVHYTGWTTDGKMFDSSVTRGQPASFSLNGVIAGWTEGLQLMVEGEKRRFWIPGKLAYGDEAGGGRPSGTLVFDVELLSIKTAPKTPEDVAKAPDDAQKTASGIASRILTKGTGTVHPKATDQVKVHYSGWTTDGKMFDSSVQRGEPIVFPLNQVIPGWTEGVQLMVEGEKRRLWIPAALAYGENAPPGAPAGTLVFDVELIQIVK
jgi:FKBP-type peptidyl-prolyl cis-trans isomerase